MAVEVVQHDILHAVDLRATSQRHHNNITATNTARHYGLKQQRPIRTLHRRLERGYATKAETDGW